MQSKTWGVKEEKPVLKRFKKNPKYPHMRSEGLSPRTNRGTPLQVEQKK